MVSKCFLSCTDVRYISRLVAILDFWIGLLLMIKCFSLLIPFNDDGSFAEQTTNNMLNDFNTFVYLLLLFIILYANCHLNYSTYDRDVHKIYPWLAINTILFSSHVLAITYIIIKNNCFSENCFTILCYSLPVCFVHVCQIYAVKCFYDDLLNCPLPISQTLCSQRSNTSATATLTPEDCVNVSVNNPTTTVPDRVCQFQNERHPVGQQQYPNVHPTSICSPQHYKPAVAPEQQLHHHCLQEYCNPPAYWPEIYSNRCLENDH